MILLTIAAFIPHQLSNQTSIRILRKSNNKDNNLFSSILFRASGSKVLRLGHTKMYPPTRSFKQQQKALSPNNTDDTE